MENETKIKIRLKNDAPEKCEIVVGNLSLVLERGKEYGVAPNAFSKFLGTDLIEIVNAKKVVEAVEAVEMTETTETTETTEKLEEGGEITEKVVETVEAVEAVSDVKVPKTKK